MKNWFQTFCDRLFFFMLLLLILLKHEECKVIILM